MRFYVVTVFPQIITDFCAQALLGKALLAGHVTVTAINPRDFTTDRHRSVDDTPYGGGSGMVMRPGPLVEAMERAEALEAEAGGGRPLRVLLTPQGEPLKQARVRSLAESSSSLTLVCGRYEGVDERARARVDLELSLGDFVLMGGELAALALIEASARLAPGVLGNPESTGEESHSAGLLEYPQYTRPAEFRGDGVPEVLIGGNHAAIAAWRRQQSILRTAVRRPELLEAAALSPAETRWLAEQSARGPEGPT